jgi:hypothetical protein
MISDIKSTVVSKEEIISLLSQKHYCPDIQNNRFFSIIFQLPSNQYIYVLHSEDGKLDAIITLLIEQRLSDGGSLVAHITDLVISKDACNIEDIQRHLLNHCINRAIDFKCCRIAVHCEQLRNECLKQRFSRDSPGFTLSLRHSV